MHISRLYQVPLATRSEAYHGGVPTLQLIITSIKHVYYGNITLVRIIADMPISLEQQQRAPSLVKPSLY